MQSLWQNGRHDVQMWCPVLNVPVHRASRKRSLSLSHTPTPTPTSPPAASMSVLSHPSPVHATLEDVSPTKRSKYIKEGIDESIERGRKGEV